MKYFTGSRTANDWRSYCVCMLATSRVAVSVSTYYSHLGLGLSRLRLMPKTSSTYYVANWLLKCVELDVASL